MTRDQLEAEIWRRFTEHKTCRAPTPCPHCAAAVAAILTAADHYATTEVGLLTPAERRQILHQTTQPKDTR